MIVILVPFPTARRGRRKVYRIEEEEDGWAEKEGVEKEKGRGGMANNGTKKCRKWGGEEDEPPAFFSIPLPLPRSEGTLQKQTEEGEGSRPIYAAARKNVEWEKHRGRRKHHLLFTIATPTSSLFSKTPSPT